MQRIVCVALLPPVTSCSTAIIVATASAAWFDLG